MMMSRAEGKGSGGRRVGNWRAAVGSFARLKTTERP